MLAKAREGYDVVYGQRVARAGETAFKKASASAFIACSVGRRC